ncbi:hypothetical protein [Streptomyces longispororuber]|uniref:hypothetical protein n=1 Tax=Streptomyces longispororuber TaxID=68230 RepID=UPI0036F6EFBD
MNQHDTQPDQHRVRTFDGVEWELRARTETGLALYAVTGSPQCCPPHIMATLTELAERGIQTTDLASAVTQLGAIPLPAGNTAPPAALLTEHAVPATGPVAAFTEAGERP